MHFKNRNNDIVSARELVRKECTPSRWDCSGELEKARAQADNATEMLGKLVQILSDKHILSIEDMKELIGDSDLEEHMPL